LTLLILLEEGRKRRKRKGGYLRSEKKESIDERW